MLAKLFGCSCHVFNEMMKVLNFIYPQKQEGRINFTVLGIISLLVFLCVR